MSDSTASREKKYNELRKNTGVSARTQHNKNEERFGLKRI
jgi:hypothetical protein